MDVLLQRIEALAGDGRYTVTFRRADGGEQTAVAQVTGGAVELAEASLPAGVSRGSSLFVGIAEAVRVFDAARRLSAPSAMLSDVDGGWDVGLGNVVLGSSGRPECTAHGDMTLSDERWVCADCGAQAVLR